MPALEGLRSRKEILLPIEAEGAGVVDVVHLEEEGRVDQTLEGVVVITAEIWRHLVGIGTAETRTLHHRITESKALAGITGPKTKRSATEINEIVKHFPAFHRMANWL